MECTAWPDAYSRGATVSAVQFRERPQPDYTNIRPEELSYD